MVLWLKDIDKSMKELGDKARFLGELFDEVPVPKGFVLDYQFFEKFLNRTGLKRKVDEALDRNDLPTVHALIREEEIPEELKAEIIEAYKEINVSKDLEKVGEALNFIKAGQENPYVAVRVSGKYPGDYDYSLNVKGKQSLISAIKKCWVSAAGEQDFAVLVQKMCDSQKSGVLATANPVNNDSSKIVIEANYGLPESVTAGLSLPDYYIIDKADGSVRSRVQEKSTCVRRGGQGDTERIPVHKDDRKKQVLDDKDFKRLRKLVEKVESCFNKPQLIEFGFERNRLFVLQAMPLPAVKIVEKDTQGKTLAQGIVISPGYAEGTVGQDVSLVETLTTIKGPTIAEKGSILCKESIKARLKGIPVVLIPDLKSKIKEGTKIVLDAYKGKISEILEEKHEIVPIKMPELPTPQSQAIPLQKPDFSPRADVSATRVQLLLQSGEYLDNRADSFIFEINASPYHLFAEARDHEFSQRLSQLLKEVAGGVHPKTVWYKSIDIVEDSLLGWHGIRRNFSRVVQLELEVLKALHHQGLTNIHYLVPYISDVNELKRVKEIARSIGLPLTMKFGITVETPSAALNIDQFCSEGIDFVFFLPETLSQLSMGIDKDLSQASGLFRLDHPSVLRQIEYAVKQCKSSNVDTAVLIPEERPELVDTFIRLGLGSIVVRANAYEQAMIEITRAERRLLLEKKREYQ